MAQQKTEYQEYRNIWILIEGCRETKENDKIAKKKGNFDSGK